MSNFGYQNTRRKKLEVSINSIAEYVSDLRKATNTAHSEFAKIQKKNTNFQAQINENILQIDDEYYAVARAKSKIISDQRTTSKLNQGGVDFIELRVAQGMPLTEAVVDAGAVRFRPMLLTAAAVIVGATVILFDPIFQGLAIALMAGEVASLLLSRMAVPVLYYMAKKRTL